MPRTTPKAERLELRNWLRRTIQFGVLDRVPPRFRVGERGEETPTYPYARGLLNELNDPDGGTRSLEDVIGAIRTFREWVEERQLTSRRVIMASVPERPYTRPTEVYRAPRFGVTAQSSQPSTEWTLPNPNEHPLWDKWLDT